MTTRTAWRFTELADAAAREQMTFRGILSELLLAECDDLDERRRARRIRDAAFPRDKRLTDFDYTANPSANPASVTPSPLAPGSPPASRCA